jgi:peptidoglycan/xylan/chitin deacetylase (PgdA/CDA1 family)
MPQRGREVLYELHPGRGRRWARHPGQQNLAEGGQVALTFDDGPDEDATPAVLDALDRVQATATFFVLGSQVLAHRDLAHEIVRRGHEIALHGHEHIRHDRVARAVSRSDIARGAATIQHVLGVQCERYRPPYGKMSEGAASACRDLRLSVVYWSAWGLDWEELSPQRIAVVALRQLTGGSIVLLHDSARFARRTKAAATAEAIPLIAEGARARNLALGSLRAATGASLVQAG